MPDSSHNDLQSDRQQEIITRTRLNIRAALRCFDINFGWREHMIQAEITCTAVAIQTHDRLNGDWSKDISYYLNLVSTPGERQQ